MTQEMYNIGFEQSVLSSLIFEPVLIDEYFHDLTSNDLFFLSAHQSIFKAVIHLHTENLPVEEGLLNAYLIKKGDNLEKELVSILTANPISNIQPYIDELKNYSQKRQLANIVSTFNRELHDDSISGDLLLSQTLERLEYFRQTHRVSLLEMHDITSLKNEEAEFICKAWLPFPKKTVSMITAPGGSGKSWLVLQLMMHHAIENPHAKSFAWLSEDPTGLSAHRASKIATSILDKKIQEFAGKIIISNSPTIQILEEQGRGVTVNPYFNDFKKNLMPYSLIILDPLIAFFGADENNNAHARKFMQLFTEWAARENKTVIFIHHSTKNTTQSRGASAFTDAVRLVYEISPVTNKDGTLDETRSHLRKIILTKDNYGASNPLGGKQIVRQIFPETKSDTRSFMKDF